jgi:WD40 repeat protein
MKLEINKIAEYRGHNASIYSLSKFNKSESFLSAAGDGWIVEWNCKNPDQGKLLSKTDSNIFSILHLEDSNRLLAGNMYGGLHWIDLKTSLNYKSVQFHQKGIFAFHRINQKQLLALGGDGILSLWDISQSKCTESIQLSQQALRCISKHPKKNILAIGSSDANIYLLNSENLEILETIKNAHQNSVFSINYSPDGQYLLSAGRDAFLRVRETENNYEELPTQAAHLQTVNDIAFHPNGHIFATASRDKTIKIWDYSNFALLKVIDTVRYGAHLKSVNKLLWLDDYQLLSASDDRTIMSWEIKYSI